VHPIHMGIETDRKRSSSTEISWYVLDMAEAVNLSRNSLSKDARTLSEMRNGIFNDLMPFAIGNQRHVRKVVAANRPVATLDHMSKSLRWAGVSMAASHQQGAHRRTVFCRLAKGSAVAARYCTG